MSDRQPYWIRTVAAAVVVDLVHVNRTDLRGHGCLDILIVVSPITAQIPAHLRSEAAEMNDSHEAQVIFVGGRHAIAVQSDDVHYDRRCRGRVEKNLGVIGGGLTMFPNSFDILG